MNKQKYGQFYTTNYKHILKGMKIPENPANKWKIIEPFAGKGDLIKFIKTNSETEVEAFDIDPKHEEVSKRDTLNNPPSYKNKFVITNPPYLSRNKSKDKKLFDKYNQNDLFKCFILCLIKDPCVGGIIIVPLNFWSSIREADVRLREHFLNMYKIVRLNIFEERVFDDTSYTVCSFSFMKRNKNRDEEEYIKAHIYPSKVLIRFKLNEDNRYLIGGDIYSFCGESIVTRLTSKNYDDCVKNKTATRLLVKCIDDNEKNQISLKFVKKNQIFVDKTPKQSARTYATLSITPSISLDKQRELANSFNKILNEYRKQYHSLFLCNYRESKDISRKRISFDLVYNIVSYLLSEDWMELNRHIN